MPLVQYKKYLFKPINISFNPTYCLINGVLLNYKFKLQKNAIMHIITNIKTNYSLFIIKTYFRTFFSLILKIIDGISFGYKANLKLKGKGLRLIR